MLFGKKGHFHFAIMCDETAKEVFVQKFDVVSFNAVMRKDKKEGKPYPVTSFDTFKTAVKEAKKFIKHNGYSYNPEKDSVG